MIFSNDGSQLSCGCTDGKIRTWNVRTGEQPKPIDAHWPGEDITGLAYSTDDTILASASMDHTIKLWTMPGDQKNHPREQVHLKSTIHCGHVACLSFSYDNSLLIVGHHDRERISIYDVASGELKYQLTGGDMPVASVQMTRDGKHIISTCAAKRMKVWNLSKAECCHTWEGTSFSTVSIIDDNDIQIASIVNQYEFIIWTTAFPSETTTDYNGVIRRRYSNVSSGRDSSLLWESGITVETQRPYEIEFSKGGQKVASVDDFRGLLVYSTKDGKPLLAVKDTGLFPVHHLAFSQDRLVAVVSRMYNGIHLFYT
jgi:WD40 repeat protein